MAAVAAWNGKVAEVAFDGELHFSRTGVDVHTQFVPLGSVDEWEAYVRRLESLVGFLERDSVDQTRIYEALFSVVLSRSSEATQNLAVGFVNLLERFRGVYGGMLAAMAGVGDLHERFVKSPWFETILTILRRVVQQRTDPLAHFPELQGINEDLVASLVLAATNLTTFKAYTEGMLQMARHMLYVLAREVAADEKEEPLFTPPLPSPPTRAKRDRSADNQDDQDDGDEAARYRNPKRRSRRRSRSPSRSRSRPSRSRSRSRRPHHRASRRGERVRTPRDRSSDRHKKRRRS